jgi:hypothetical protein
LRLAAPERPNQRGDEEGQHAEVPQPKGNESFVVLHPTRFPTEHRRASKTVRDEEHQYRRWQESRTD